LLLEKSLLIPDSHSGLESMTCFHDLVSWQKGRMTRSNRPSIILSFSDLNSEKNIFTGEISIDSRLLFCIGIHDLLPWLASMTEGKDD
jgi:hypothetical protein